MRALGVVRKAGGVKAFLLAAGVGSRLRPITDTIPKCMLDIDGRPLLDIWLDAFDRAGVDEVLVNLHHLPDVVRRHLAARTGAAGRAHGLRARTARQRRHARRQPGTGSTARSSSWPATPTTSPTSTCASLIDGAPRARRDRDADRLPLPNPSAGGVVELDADRHGHRVRREAEPAGFRPGERRDVRLPSRACSTRSAARRRVDIGYDLLPAAGGPGPGRAGGGVLPRHRHRRRLPAGPGGVARSGPRDDHHPDAAAHRPARRGDGPARATTASTAAGSSTARSTSTSTSS